jgi:hypothetical protein
LHRSARTAVIAAPLVLALTLAGCSTSGGDTKPASTASSSTTAKATETKTPTITIGDAIGAMKDGKPVIITDDAGSYQKMALNPDAAFAKTIPSNNDGTAKENGFTDADILAGQKWVSEFIVSEAIDSTILDNAGGKTAWVEAHKDELEGDVLSTAQAQPNDLAFVNTQKPSDEVSVKYARDGKPRASAVTVKLNQVRGTMQGGKAFLVFDGTYAVTYRAKSSDVYDAYEAKGFTKEQVEGTLPALKAGEELPIHGTATFQWALSHDGDVWRIAGQKFHYDNSFV